MKRPLLLLFGLPGLLLIVILLYFGILLLFFGYELSTSKGAVERLIKKAVAESDPSICNHVIHPQIIMGPARYEFVNGCKYEYASATGDVSVCMNTMSPENCVTRIATERNDPDLCAQAIDPRRQGTDGRGSCFGYFAGAEKEYRWCERLKQLTDMPIHQKLLCYVEYIERTNDYTICPQLEAIHYVYNEKTDDMGLQSKQYSIDQCFLFAAKKSKSITICAKITDESIRKKCIDGIEQ